MNTTINSQKFEREQLLNVAQEYKDKGYLVVLEPSTSELPAFLAPFHPDLIAKNSTESIVVEVKTQSSLRQNFSEIQRLSHAVQSQPGWHFVLAIRNPPRVELVLSADESLTRLEMLQRISKLEKLLDKNQVKEALALIWPVIETILRQFVAQAGLAFQENRIAYLLEDLTALAIIEQADYQVLWAAVELQRDITQNYPLDDHYIQELKYLPQTLRNLIAQQAEVAVAS